MNTRIILLSLAVIMCALRSFAQAPQGIPYQAIARDNVGNPIVNQFVSFQFSVRDQSAVGTVVFRETHSATTNEFGLVNLVIGAGSVSIGTFDGINWGGGSKFLQVEFDPAGGASFIDMGTTQMLSVPYALESGSDKWINEGDNIWNDNLGNVGIGTNSPTTKLDVNGDINTNGDLYLNGSLVLRDNGFGRTQFYHADNGVKHMEFNGSNTWLSDKKVYIEKELGLGLNPGSEGIDAKLHVKGNVKIVDGTQGAGKVLTSDANGLASWQAPGVASDVTTASNGLTEVGNDVQLGGNLTTNTTITQDAGEALTINNNSTSNTIIDLQSTGDFAVRDNGAAVLTVADWGNVGIGTNLPLAKLHIQGNLILDDGTQGPGKFLKSSNTGSASWSTLNVPDLLSSPIPATLACPDATNTVATGTSPNSIAIYDNTLFVVNYYGNTIQAIDISNPASPTSTFSAPFPGSYGSLIIKEEGYAFMTDIANNQIDAFLPQNGVPTELWGSGPTESFPVSLAASFVEPNWYVYVVNDNNTLETIVFDTGGFPPYSLGSVPTGNGPQSLAISGNYIYVVNQYSNTMQVFDISDPAWPVEITAATLYWLDGPQSITISGNFAYVTNYNSGTLQVINITNPTSPFSEGQVACGSGLYAVTVSGDYAYVVLDNDNIMKAINITDPSSPTVSGGENTGNIPRSVAAKGSYAYVSNFGSNTVQVMKLVCSEEFAVTVNPLTGETTAVQVPEPFAWVENESFNVALGNFALSSNANGFGNTAIGANTLFSNVDGDGNSAVGWNSLKSNISSSGNAAFGWNSLRNSTGQHNTAIGINALYDNLEGSSNTSIGAFANVGSGNLTNSTAIGAKAYVNAPNSLVLGSIAGLNGATHNVNVGIGTSNPSAKLHVETGTSQVCINGAGSGQPFNFNSAYPLSVSGGQNGVMVQVAGNYSSNNNFISFRDDNYILGRIEGQTLSELQSSDEYIVFQTFNALEIAFNAAMIIACGAQLDVGEVAVHTFEYANVAANWITLLDMMESSVGVSYASGYGDYAEWLPRKDELEEIKAAEIVGVVGGKISKNTNDASQLMVVSTAPIVLGNYPETGKENSYEKVAFMGQVPVKVKGAVHVGDYILASGKNDGYGIGVHPDDMLLNDYSKIVGVAWSEFDVSGSTGLVLAAVGINNNDLVAQISKQQEQINKQQEQINQLINSIEQITAYIQSNDSNSKIDLPVIQSAPIMTESFETIASQAVSEEAKNQQSQQPSSKEGFSPSAFANPEIKKYLIENQKALEGILADAKNKCRESGVNPDDPRVSQFFSKEYYLDLFNGQ